MKKESMTLDEFRKKGVKARWEGTTEEERKAHAVMMGKKSGKARRAKKRLKLSTGKK